MKVVATNIGAKKEINYKGTIVSTGIYKFPVVDGIYVETLDVKDDVVVDRDSHGGVDKACYLYSADFYAYWQNLYPSLDWDYGMFGENLTVSGLDETKIFIGAQYQIGEAIVEVSQPRQPCLKFGIKMGTQAILKQFINTTYSGVYVRVLQPGKVLAGEVFKLLNSPKNAPTIAEAFYCLYQPELNRSLLNKVLNSVAIAESCKKDIRLRLK